MAVKITTTKLTASEIKQLTEETRKSIHIGFIHQNVWGKFNRILIAKDKDKLLGICVLIDLGSWIKIGPIIVLNQHQRQGIGKKLLTETVRVTDNKNLFIGSSHQAVKKIVSGLGFQEVTYSKLPGVVKKYLISYLWQRHNLDYLLDAIKKRLKAKRGKYSFFIRVV